MKSREISCVYFGMVILLGILGIQNQLQMMDEYAISTPVLSYQEGRPVDLIEGESCALLFFGAPRLFDKVLPSIRKHVLEPNPGCDVYAHTYNITSSPSGRNFTETPGSAGTSDYRQVLDLTPHTLVHSLDDFYNEHGTELPFYRENHHHMWGACCISTENMIKQWHSIQSVWNYAQASGKNYRRIGLFRLDVLYPHPIPISTNSEQLEEAAVLPRFLWNGKTSFGNLSLANDRMFFGNREHVEVWATKRFEYSHIYTNRFRNETEGRLQGLHSESMLSYMLQYYGVPFSKKDICFWRVRTSGYLTTYDCKVPGAPEGELLADSSSVHLVDGFRCCNDCDSSHLEPHPCFPSFFDRIRERFFTRKEQRNLSH